MSSVIPTVPGLAKTESFGVILVGALVAFALWRVYSTGSQLAGSVGTTLSGAGAAIGNLGTTIGNVLGTSTQAIALQQDQAAINQVKLNNLLGGAAPIPVADQSDAETARLNALAGNGLGTSTIQNSNDIDPLTNTSGGWGSGDVIIGTADQTATSSQEDSPDASGLSTWLG